MGRSIYKMYCFSNLGGAGVALNPCDGLENMCIYSTLSLVLMIVIHPHISIQDIYQIFILFCLHVLTSFHLVGWVNCIQSLGLHICFANEFGWPYSLCFFLGVLNGHW